MDMDPIIKSAETYFKSQPVFGTILVFIITLTLASQLWVYLRKGRKYPPGPVGLPIVGYLPFLLGKDLHKVYYELGKKYGPIFSLKLGQYDTVIINNFEGIRESGKLAECSGRPPNFFVWDDNIPHIGCMSGQIWKVQRRFFSSTLRNVGMSSLKVEDSIQEQISICIEAFKSRHKEVDVNLRRIIGPAINNVIMSLVCGKTFDVNHKIIEMQSKHQHIVLSYFEDMRMPFFFPWFYKLYEKVSVSLRNKRMEMKDFEKALRNEIKEHRLSLNQSDDKKDYIDHYLSESEKNESFNEEILLGNCQLVLLAGGETTRSTLEWTLLLLAQHQLLQEIVHKQIIDFLGTDKRVEWKDRDNLPLVQAVIYEVIRFKTLVCVNDPHQVSKDTEFCGFQLPKGTVLFTNLWAVNNDAEFWGDPENFRPERFLSKDFKNLVNRDRIVSFGHGKRICPGEKLAEVEIFLFITTLLQKFRFVPPEKGINLDEETAITQMVIHPIARIEPR